MAWLKGFVTGDLGRSVRTGLPIGQMVMEKLPVTIELSILSMLIAVVFGVSLGVVAALRRRLDRGITRSASSGWRGCPFRASGWGSC